LKFIRKHRKLTAAILIALVVLGAYGGACEYFYRVAFIPSTKTFLNNKVSKRERANRDWLAAVDKQTWTQTAVGHSDWQLKADYVPAASKSSKTVVVAHGYMNTKEDMAAYIRMFHNAGYNVLAPDDRGHGQSDGTYIGYGWADRRDYQKWLQQLLRREGSKQRIALFGVSMGGATVMYLSGMNLPQQVRAIVEDCGYTSVDAELSFQAKSMYNLPSRPLVPSVLRLAQLHTGVDYPAASATQALKKNKLPTFFIHGAQDKFVPTKMVYANYKASAGEKKLWVVSGAGHAQSELKHPAEYKHRVLGFLSTHLR
jgi:fermentation-respiration switch protein FrsA (DUF1100 family)